MRAVSTIHGRAIPLGLKNVDTDVIIPAHWLKTVSREGLGKGAFETIRQAPGNPFDVEDFEHAAWAMLDMGLTAVIAPSFSDIFSGNAFKNGILAVELPEDQVDRLLEVARTDPITIDLDNQIVTTPFQDRFAFDVDTFRKRCLLEGLDEIGLTLASGDAITHHEAGRAQDLPWLDCPLAVSR